MANTLSQGIVYLLQANRPSRFKQGDKVVVRKSQEGKPTSVFPPIPSLEPGVAYEVIYVSQRFQYYLWKPGDSNISHIVFGYMLRHATNIEWFK